MNDIFLTKTGKKVYSAAIRAIDEYGMQKQLRQGVLVGLSGGADSVMLLLLLLKIKSSICDFPIIAVHVNHMIRGDEADRDEKFSENLCKELNVEFKSVRINVPQIAKELQDVSDNKVKALIQNALDALSIVNQLALKDNKTSEQEAMLAEQAKLSLIKIQEAKKNAAEAPMDYKQTVAKMEKSASQMVAKMSQLQRTLPHIVIIPKLTEQATQNLNILQSAQTRLATASQNEQTAVLTEASNAYKAIETAYANVMRFDTSGVVYTPNTSSTPRGVRGKISK